MADSEGLRCQVQNWLLSLVTSLVSVLSERSSSLLAPLLTLLLMAWRYRAVILNRFVYYRGSIALIYERQFRNCEAASSATAGQAGRNNNGKAGSTSGLAGSSHGEACLFKAKTLLDSTLREGRLTCLVLVLGGPAGEQDCQLFHHLAVYIRHMAHKRRVPVLTFLEGEVTNASYILACAGDALIAAPAARIRLDWEQGGLGAICSRLRPRASLYGRSEERVPADWVGAEQAREAGLVDRVGTYMEFLLEHQGAQLEVVQGTSGPEIFGFIPHSATRPSPTPAVQ